ncbi:hypothetical protein [Denitromonas halophila]|uniref:hypothetical protein n=1 Tax=Denitromonas halophila TaxID=1629404 RepID=UPI001C90401C|nr:hypothetical protein [Denitromonas halophila]
MSDAQAPEPARFGTILGVAAGEVAVYSSHYPSADHAEYPDRHSYRSYLDGEYMGYKWQCVELARRWLYLNKGYVFDDVPMAYDIFRLRSVRVVKDDRRLPLHTFHNGARRHPVPRCANCAGRRTSCTPCSCTRPRRCCMTTVCWCTSIFRRCCGHA